MGITDIRSDSTGRLEAWVRDNFEVPAWADGADKEAELAPDLPATAFAWPEARRFPVDSRASAWWSAVSLGRMSADPLAPRQAVEKVAENLAEAMKFWGISKDEFRTIDKSVAEKAAELEFDLVLSSGGETLDTVQCRSMGEFAKTAEWLTTVGREAYPYECRRDAARSMLASGHAQKLDEPLRVQLEKTACHGAVSRASMINMLDILSKGLDKQGLAEYDGMLEDARKSCPAIVAGAELDKTAAMLDGVHRALRELGANEGLRLPPLEEQLNIQTPTMLEKAGQSFVVFPDGRFVDDEEFDKNAGRILEYVNGVLEKGATRETLRDVVEALDAEESCEFTEALSAMGI
jgi:hypothetical protein